MNITLDILNRYVRTISIDEAAVERIAEKARENLRDFGYITDGIENLDAVLRFTAREKLRRGYLHTAESSLNETERSEAKKKASFVSKGLILMGSCGRGKTRLAQWVAANIGAEYYSMSEIDEAYALNPYADFQAKFSPLFGSDKILVIDDLGSESGIRRYNNDTYSGQIIEKLYTKWQLYGTPCVLTTNLVPYSSNGAPSIMTQYGERAVSRIMEMCDLVAFTGKKDYRLN